MASGQYKTFLVSYRHNGAEWNIELPALDYDDAKDRLARLCFASVDGEIIATIPASLGPFMTAIVAVRNAAHRLFNPGH